MSEQEPRHPPHCSGKRVRRDRFVPRDGGDWIDDDDFLYDATIRIGGDFDEGQKLAFAQWICDVLNAAVPPFDPASRGIKEQS